MKVDKNLAHGHSIVGLELVRERISKIGDFSIEEIKDEKGDVKGKSVTALR